MNQAEKQHIDNLLKTSICDKCEELMKEIKIPLNQLPFDYVKLLLTNRLKYLVVRCSKCGSQGLHLYK